MGFGLSLVDPRAWAHLFRLVHFYNYNHVTPLRAADVGLGVRMSPTVSLRNGERIKIGAYAHLGSNCSLWAGDSVGRITLGRHALLGPEVFITASNYETEPGTPVMDQPKRERDVVIGDDVWLGARVVVVPGVEIGDGCTSAQARWSPGRFRPVRSRSETRPESSAGGAIRKPSRRFGKPISSWGPLSPGDIRLARQRSGQKSYVRGGEVNGGT